MKKTLTYLLLLLLAAPVYSKDEYKAVSRFDYYTDEANATIAVWIPETKVGIDVTVDIVLEFNHVYKGEKVRSKQFNLFDIPLERLSTGSNEVTVSYYENGKWIASDKVKIILRKPHYNAVKTDRVTGSLIVEGLPFFPFGFYNYSPVQPTLAEEEVVKGFNMMSPYQKIEGKTLKERKAYMDRCAGLGMKVNYNLLSLAGGGGVGHKHYDKLSHRKRIKMLREEIEAFRDHPALLSWYISDEPVGQGVPPDSLVEAYELIKELDPYHPVAVVFMSPGMASEYSHVMDIVMADPYPVPSGKVDEVGAVAAQLSSEFFMEKPVWIVPQAFGGNEWWEREPTAQELRLMTYLGILNNASGIQYFIRHGMNSFPKSTITWNEASAVAQEVAEIQPYLFTTEPEPVISCSDPDIQVKGYYRQGAYVVVALNTSTEPRHFSFTVEGLNYNGSARLLFENRYVEVLLGKVVDMIDTYGTRVYKIRHTSLSVREFKVHPKNEMKDPSFEGLAGFGVPESCYARVQDDRGATYFLDTRDHTLGEHSLRLTTPTQDEGMVLSFFPIGVNEYKSYTVSVTARALPLKYRDPLRKGFFRKLFGGGPDGDAFPEFTLTFGSCNRSFTPGNEWKEYSFSCIPLESGSGKASASLTLNGKGTAWFDLLQVYPDMRITSGVNRMENEVMIGLSSSHRKTDIFYTTDGSDPGMSSKKYIGAFKIKESATVKAANYSGGEKIGYIEKYYVVSYATGRYVEYKNKWSPLYPADYGDALVDGLLGTANFKDGNWQGFEGDDLEILINLKDIRDIRNIQLRFLENQASWIFLPTQIQVFWSEDGIDYKPLETMPEQTSKNEGIHVFTYLPAELQARYILVVARNTGTCPEGHPGAGGKAWLFTDEIIIN